MQWREESRPGRGIRLHVRRVIEPVAPPVLLLHGLGVGGSIWQAFARRLLPDLAAVAPDLRGHGESDAPPTGYTPADYAGDLIELLTDADGEGLAVPVAVVGHSLGALVALELAATRPDLVRWLVLLDPPLDPRVDNPEVAEVYRLRHAPAGELEAYLLGRNPAGGHLLANALSKLFRQASDAAFEAFLAPGQTRRFAATFDPDGEEESSPTSFSTVASDENGRESSRTSAETTPGPRGGEDSSPSPDSPASRGAAGGFPSLIERPVLVLQADPSHGGLLGDTAARDFVGRLPRGRLLKITGASHALHASHPAEVASAILEFGRYSSEVDSDADSR
jgi:pimeloyl-ACP methyl ester carboxylesterase